MLPRTAIISTFVLALVLGERIDDLKSDFQVVDTVNNFGIQFYKELSKRHENLICSGFSIATILTMLLTGARGNTKKELRNALGYESAGLMPFQVEKSYRVILQNATHLKQQNGFELDVANSVWFRQRFRMLPDFEWKMSEVFFVDQEEIDFSNADATKSINSWVSRKTKQNIPKLFDEPLDPSTVLLLVNAMYFKGTWVTKFDKSLTSDDTFWYKNSKMKKDIPMMNIVSTFPYRESPDLNAQLLELPYDGKEISMVVVLPKSVDGLRQLHDKLDIQKLKLEMEKLVEERVQVKIPKFKSSSNLNLNDVLMSMGIKDAFGQGAHFAGIDGHNDLFVSQAIQNAVVEVNEDGTEAAVASGINMQLKSMPDIAYFTADHPFMYFIRHKQTGILLFIGSKTEP